MSRHGGMSRIERVNVLIVDREDRRIQREQDAIEAGKRPRVWEPASDPRKFPWYALGGELLPMPKDGLFP